MLKKRSIKHFSLAELSSSGRSDSDDNLYLDQKHGDREGPRDHTVTGDLLTNEVFQEEGDKINNNNNRYDRLITKRKNQLSHSTLRFVKEDNVDDFELLSKSKWDSLKFWKTKKNKQEKKPPKIKKWAKMSP